MRSSWLFGSLIALSLVACAAPDGADTASSTEAALSVPTPTGSTHSTRTPMGIHFERLLSKVPSADERAFFADATREPNVPGSTPGFHFQRFDVTLYPSGTPEPSDVNQHGIGDCSAASVWASLSMQAPDFVQGLIDDYGDGTFGVHVFDPAGRTFVIDVDSSFLANGSNGIEAVTAKSGRADWATVLEKAALKYLQVYSVVGNIGGIGSEFASPIFTGSGESRAYAPGSLTPAQLTRVVGDELARGKIIIGGFNQVRAIGDVNTVTAHAYMIANPEDGAMVTMRNPWGASPRVNGGYDPTHDGYIDVPATAEWARTVDLRIIDAR